MKSQLVSVLLPLMHPITQIPAKRVNSCPLPVKVQETVAFTATLAHEVRNPLTNINLAVEMLASLNAGAEEKLLLDIIIRASARINELITALVRQQQTVITTGATYSMCQLLDEVLRSNADRISLKHINVTKEYAATDYTQPLDMGKMKIAISNIIINAIDAMQATNGRLIVETETVHDRFTIRITDNGCGISPANMDNIFKPYFTQKPGGLGIGLAATFDILKASKVLITVKSTIGKGTNFVLSFPRQAVPVIKISTRRNTA